MSKRFIYYGSFASVVIDYFTNLFGVPAAAYSLRKLSPNSVYSGAAIRVRRSSDNTEQDINFVNSDPDAGIDTSALLSFVGAGNGFVVTWYDQSGNGIGITQSVGSDQPQIVSSGSVITEGGKPTVKFSPASNGNYLQTASINNFQGLVLDIYSTIKIISYSSNGSVFFGSTTSSVYWQIGIANRAFVQGGGFITGIAVNDGIRRIVNHYVVGSNTKSVTYNNSSPFTRTETPTTITSANQVFTIGRWMGGTQWNLNGEIQELIIFPQNQSAKSSIKTNINDYYNVF